MPKHLLIPALLALATFALVSLPTQDAHAGLLGLVLGIEVDGASGFAVKDDAGNELDVDTDFGFGGKLRLGYEAVDILPIKVIPELQLQYTRVGSSQDFLESQSLDYTQNYYIGRVGARVGTEFIVGIYAYGHIGAGTVSVSSDNSALEDAINDQNDWGFSYDAGLALNMTLIPLFLSAGAHGGYNAIVEDDATFSWYDFGLHLELKL